MKTYNAAVEVDAHDGDVDELMAALEAYHPAVGISPRGWLEVRISVPAESLVQACVTAATVVESFTGAAAIACEVMTEAEFDAREGFTSEPDLLSAGEAAEILGVSTERVRQLAVANRIQSVPVGGRRNYVRTSVEALAAKDRPGGRPRKETN
jgi:excisionase family DNA binding protein